MADDIDLGGSSLSPEENAYFASGGTTEIPTGEKAAETGETNTGTTTTEKTATTDATGEKAAEAAKVVEADKVEKMVSLSALHEERNRRKTTETEKRKLETEVAELRGKFSILERINAPKAAETAALPTVETDIFGVVKNQAETIAQFQKRFQDEDAGKKAAAEHNDLVTAYRMDASQFEAKTPDFKAAYDHLLKSRAAELTAMGYDDPVQLHQALTNDEMAIARMGISQKKSPAEIIYNLAQQRGYAKPVPKNEQEEAAKAAAAEAAKTAAADKIDTINKGQAANKSLSNTGGSAGDGEMTGEMLLKMPMDEFEAWTTKNPAKAKRLMGG